MRRGNGGGKKSVLISVEEKRFGKAQTLRKESEENFFGEVLTTTKSDLRSSEKREDIESIEKNRPCLTKKLMSPLACGSFEEKMPDRK